MIPELEKRIERNKFIIVRLLLTYFPIAGISYFLVQGTLIYLFNLTELNRGDQILNWVSYGVITLILFARFVLHKRSYQLSFIVFLIGTTFLATTALTLTPGLNWLAYFLFTINIATASFVFETRSIVFTTGAQILIILVIWILRESGMLGVTQVNTAGNFFSPIIVTIMVGLTAYVVKIGYSQIEESFAQSQEYASKLSKLNQNLDEEVKLRTVQLKRSYDNQMNSMYANAAIGQITKSMLHDIATPLSTAKGSLKMLKDETDNDDLDVSLLDMAIRATNQINSIVSNSHSLMNNDLPKEIFSPAQSIRNLLIITRHQLQSEGIDITTDIPEEIEIDGVLGVFERIMINLITNASEELVDSDKQDLKISVSGRKDKRFFTLKVHDNGRGIDQDYLRKIFEPEFTSKRNNKNGGMGLAFVKNSVEKFFDGTVEVSTRKGEFTEFVLRLSLK